MTTEKILRPHAAAAFYSAMCLANMTGARIIITHDDECVRVAQDDNGAVFVELHSVEHGVRREGYATSVDFAAAYGVRA